MILSTRSVMILRFFFVVAASILVGWMAQKKTRNTNRLSVGVRIWVVNVYYVWVCVCARTVHWTLSINELCEHWIHSTMPLVSVRWMLNAIEFLIKCSLNAARKQIATENRSMYAPRCMHEEVSIAADSVVQRTKENKMKSEHAQRSSLYCGYRA